MYYIRKYADCWAVHDDITGASRKLTEEEKAKVAIEFEVLLDDNVLTVYADQLRSLQDTLAHYTPRQHAPPGL